MNLDRYTKLELIYIIICSLYLGWPTYCLKSIDISGKVRMRKLERRIICSEV